MNIIYIIKKITIFFVTVTVMFLCVGGTSTIMALGNNPAGDTTAPAPPMNLRVNNSLSVSSVSGSGGSIIPRTVTLDYGKTTRFTVTADANHNISSVRGCGGSLSGDIYVTGVITKGCSVIALFHNNAPVESKSFIQAIADGSAKPVMINGQAWTFRTPPPPEGERTVRAGHPRLILTPDNVPAIRVKLQDPLYSTYMKVITSRADNGSMLENAFLYQITGDTARGLAAKEALLNYNGVSYGEGIIRGYDMMSDRLGPVLVFDWIMDMLSRDEKIQIFANVKDNFGYNHKTANPVKHEGNGAGTYPWYFNDVYNRHPEIYLPALAFAITNEGIDDAWANEVIAWAYDEDETRVMGPYGPKRGSGFLDAMNSMTLDTGGLSHTGYFPYISEVFHAVAFWETATGQPMWNRMSFLEKDPQAYLTSRDNIVPHTRTVSILEYATGMYGGDTASTAKYALEKFGYPSYMLVYRAIFGDIRVVVKRPDKLSIPVPTAKYVRGDHTFYSKSSWADDAVSLYVRSPYINANRYVGSEGVFAIYKGDKAIAPRVDISKTAPDAGIHSGMWIYDPAKKDKIGNTFITSRQNRGTYWSNFRSHDAWTTVSQSRYFEGGPKSIEVTNSYRAVSMEYGKRYHDIAVGTAQRTIIHIPDGARNFIVIYDYINAASNLKSAWQMRLMEEPTVSGSEFSLAGTMKATVISPQDHTLEWLGGLNNEFVTPSPEKIWYTNKRGQAIPGYSVNRPTAIHALGLGNLYIQPQGQKGSSVGPFEGQTEYLVVLEISETAPVAVTRISDREVAFDRWQISFSPDGTYTVSNR